MAGGAANETICHLIVWRYVQYNNFYSVYLYALITVAALNWVTLVLDYFFTGMGRKKIMVQCVRALLPVWYTNQG
jgi:hypothetical protein